MPLRKRAPSTDALTLLRRDCLLRNRSDRRPLSIAMIAKLRNKLGISADIPIGPERHAVAAHEILPPDAV